MFPAPIADHLTDILSTRILRVTPVGGGTINRVATVTTADEILFLKWQLDAPPGAFRAEADGLSALGGASTIRTPTVRAVAERLDARGLGYLALEYLPDTPPRDPAAFTRRFAEELAALHRPKPASFGWPEDNYLGITPQANLPRSDDWAEFFLRCRLLPQIDRARSGGRLTPEREALLSGVAERTPDLLADIPPEVSLIHGDLWSGNFLCAAMGDPVLIDPAAYDGHREMEMAYVELFGGFPPGFMAAYQSAWPLDAGYVGRRPLHQLYHLVNHLN
ncbi:MAG: fructosamine kinase family protein, partial [Capsulimonadales bacterium]|nr:fructosamine kinase family protein [Capsulimonadales bacterium]